MNKYVYALIGIAFAFGVASSRNASVAEGPTLGSCGLEKISGFEPLQFNGKTVFKNRSKGVVFSISCGEMKPSEKAELLNTFSDRKKIDPETSFVSLESSGDSFARIYFYSKNRTLIQLAAVGKAPDISQTDKDAVSALRQIAMSQK